MDRQKIQQNLEILKNNYPKAKIILKYGNPWELLVAVILSAQCTDKTVNRVTEKLFSKYRTIKDYLNADREEFEIDIRSTGFFRNKAKNILASAKIVNGKFGCRVPDSMEGLLTLPGVARKTANIILGNAYGVVEGIAVDTHVSRISQRLDMVDTGTIGGKNRYTFVKNGEILTDYIKDADPDKIEHQLMNVVPRSGWFDITYRIIDHGRAVCKAQNPDCVICPLYKSCRSSRV
jgi:endonuclease-3